MSNLEIGDMNRQEWFVTIYNIEKELAHNIGMAFDVLIVWRVVEA